MWPRIVEVMLAAWLWMSPFVFGYPELEGDKTLLWVLSLGASSLVATAALCSYRGPWHRAHLASAVIGLVISALGYLVGGVEAPPAYQNMTLTGLLIVMFAVIPSENLTPPRRWREFYEKDHSLSRSGS